MKKIFFVLLLSIVILSGCSLTNNNSKILINFKETSDLSLVKDEDINILFYEDSDYKYYIHESLECVISDSDNEYDLKSALDNKIITIEDIMNITSDVVFYNKGIKRVMK